MDYEEAIGEYAKFLNYDAKAIWKNKKKWILISEPEIYFQDIFLARLEYMFVDGRLMHDHPLAGGELDFLIEGESLDKPVLIEIKWVGKSISRNWFKENETYTIMGKKDVQAGAEQVILYEDDYNRFSLNGSQPTVLIIDVEPKRETYGELGDDYKHVMLYWARLDAISPSKKSKKIIGKNK